VSRRVLVTGAGGFIGRHAVPALRARGFDVATIGRRALPHLSPDVVQHTADLLQPNTADVVARIGASHLLHLAWDVRPGLFWAAPENLDWVAASLLVYRGFVAGGGQRLVVAGSCAEYDWRHALLDEANTPLRPATLYGVAKHALHQMLRAAAPVTGVTLGWGRLFFVYGPHEATSRLVASVARALVRQEPALCGDGLAERDFMRAEDAGAAFAALLDSGIDDAVNVASGQCVAVAEVVRTLARLAGRPDLLRLGARPPVAEPPRLAAATVRLRQTGFAPAATLEQGLAATLDWWRLHETVDRARGICH
jgi:nucleoside-diphosphate-sugar epimerase